MKSPHKSFHWLLTLATLSLMLFTSGCATEKQKRARALKKEKGSTEWYAERHRKRDTRVKDKREKRNVSYSRGQKPFRNPGTGLTVPKTEKKK